MSSSGIDRVLAQADEMVTTAMNASPLARLGIGIVYQGQVLYAKGFGLAHVQQERPVIRETVFRIGSIAKTMTAIGLIQLWEQSTFQLDAPVNAYVKAYQETPDVRPEWDGLYAPGKGWKTNARLWLACVGEVEVFCKNKHLALRSLYRPWRKGIPFSRTDATDPPVFQALQGKEALPVVFQPNAAGKVERLCARVHYAGETAPAPEQEGETSRQPVGALLLERAHLMKDPSHLESAQAHGANHGVPTHDDPAVAMDLGPTHNAGEAQVIAPSPLVGARPVTIPSRNRLVIALCLLSLYLIWGSTFLAMRIALEGFPPFLALGLRFLIAGSILYGILRARGAPAPSRIEWRGAIVVGALLLAGGTGGVIFAEQWVASGLAALGTAAIPLWAAFCFGLWGRWPRRLEWVGLVLGFSGVMLLNLESGVRAAPSGAIALLLAPISWALGSAWSQHITLPQGLLSSAAQMLAGGIILLAASLVFREGAPHIHTVRPLLALAFLVFFSSLLAFSAYGYLLGHVRPALATSYAYTNPVVAVALGVGVAGEHLTLLGILAMFVILSGVGVVSLAKAPKKPGQAEERSRGCAASCFEFPQSDHVVRHHVKLAGEQDENESTGQDDESKGAGSGGD